MDAVMIDFRTIGKSMPRERYSRGSLKKSDTKPQKWLGDWYIYREDKRVHRGPKVIGLCAKMTKTEAQAELDRMIAADRSAADQKAPGEITLGWLLRQYLELKTPTWGDSMIAFNTWLFNKHLIPAFEGRAANSITRADLQGYLNGLAANGGSQSFVSKCRLYLKAVFADAVEDDQIAKDPARKLLMPKCKAKCKRFLTEAECEQLFANLSGRDRLIVRIFVVLGLRPSELLALNRDDKEPGRIRIDQTAKNGKVHDTTKTDESKGYVALPPSMEIELSHWLEISPIDPAGLIFPSEKPGVPMRRENFLNRIIKPAAEAAGLDGVNFQSFRRTTATHVPGVGGSVKDAQAMLRHASPQMTVGTYMQSIPESVKAAVEALDAKLYKGPIQ